MPKTKAPASTFSNPDLNEAMLQFMVRNYLESSLPATQYMNRGPDLVGKLAEVYNSKSPMNEKMKTYLMQGLLEQGFLGQTDPADFTQIRSQKQSFGDNALDELLGALGGF